MTREQRLLDIYTGAAIALLFLTATANALWTAIFAVALVGAGLVVFPTQRPRIITVGLVGAAAGLIVAVVVRVFA